MLAITSKYSIQIQKEYDYLNSALIARHYLLSDLKSAHAVAYTAQQLSILGEQTILYELRQSKRSLSLYRKEGERFAALVDGIIDWRVSVNHQRIALTIVFKNNKTMEIKECLDTA